MGCFERRYFTCLLRYRHPRVLLLHHKGSDSRNWTSWNFQISYLYDRVISADLPKNIQHRKLPLRCFEQWHGMIEGSKLEALRGSTSVCSGGKNRKATVLYNTIHANVEKWQIMAWSTVPASASKSWTACLLSTYTSHNGLESRLPGCSDWLAKGDVE